MLISKIIKNLLPLMLLSSIVVPVSWPGKAAADPPCTYAVCSAADITGSQYTLQDANHILANFPGGAVTFTRDPTESLFVAPAGTACKIPGKSGKPGGGERAEINASPAAGTARVDMFFQISGECKDTGSRGVKLTVAGVIPPGGSPPGGFTGDPSCNTGKVPVPAADLQKCLETNPIVSRLNTIVNFLAGLVGIVVIGVIIFGGIQYISAGDNATQITAAKQRIMNGIIALLIFIFTYAFLQWLIPGGVFR